MHKSINLTTAYWLKWQGVSLSLSEILGSNFGNGKISKGLIEPNWGMKVQMVKLHISRRGQRFGMNDDVVESGIQL